MQRVQKLDESGEEGSDLEQGTVRDKWAGAGDQFWQVKALGIFWCPGSSVVAMNVTQGSRGSPDSRVSKLFNVWLCNRGMLLLHVLCYC